MILTAHQPGYLPWIGLFHKIYLADFFCFFDIAQYQNKEYDNRNKVLTHNGPIWLTVPVESKNHLNKKLFEIKVVQNGWQKKHLKTIELSYKKTKFFNNYYEELEFIIRKNHTLLIDLNIEIIEFIIKSLGLKTKIVRASDYKFEGAKSSLVLDMCNKLGAKNYIFGSQGKNYCEINEFKACNVQPYFQSYNHPTYHQQGEFISHMSIIDLLFNEGDKSLEIILSGNAKNISEMPS